MRNFLARSNIAILLALQVFSPVFVFTQQGSSQKRSQTTTQTSASQETGPRKSYPPSGSPEWNIGEPLRIVSDEPPILESSSGPEPTIRVALATDVRAATISTTGHLMNASDQTATLLSLNVARVRLEPHLLSPTPIVDNADRFGIQIAGLPTRADAEQKAREVREASGEDSQIAYDSETKMWGLIVGARRPQIEAEELRLRLEDAGFDATLLAPGARSSLTKSESASPSAVNSNASIAKGNVSQQIPARSATAGNVRPTARFISPSREVVASAPGAGRLFSSSAPVTFASDSETTPVRFDDKPYRGRIEVFTNTRGALTVVNVLGLEDYVKGVVPNELSAGGYPLIEAHKAQAIAARTYALRNRGQFVSQGYDLLE